MNNLVSTEWLAGHLADDDLCIFDCSWHLPTAKRDAKAEFALAHISGAQFFDLDAISDTETKLPHMLPSANKFGHSVSKIGASNAKKIICYDCAGLFSAARVWWMFKTFSHENVAVLNGGMKKWRAENRHVQSGPALQPKRGNFHASLQPNSVKSIEEVAAATALIIDARAPTRFRGEEAEPRPGVKPGHIPGARNIHYATLLNDDGTLRKASDLKSIFDKAEVNLEEPIITSCGSGVTAAILSLALTELGAKDHALYDGSWAEWGASGREIVTGP